MCLSMIRCMFGLRLRLSVWAWMLMCASACIRLFNLCVYVYLGVCLGLCGCVCLVAYFGVCMRLGLCMCV